MNENEELAFSKGTIRLSALSLKRLRSTVLDLPVFLLSGDYATSWNSSLSGSFQDIQPQFSAFQWLSIFTVIPSRVWTTLNSSLLSVSFFSVLPKSFKNDNGPCSCVNNHVVNISNDSCYFEKQHYNIMTHIAHMQKQTRILLAHKHSKDMFALESSNIL